MSWRGRPWLALLPVLLGLLGWWLWWDRAAGRWQAQLGEVLTRPERVIGFPYRLQADFGPLALARAHGGAGVEARASSATVERAFARPWPHVFAATGLVARAEAGLPAGIALGLEAPALRGSLDLAGGQLNRLSLVMPSARLELGWLGGALNLAEAELHLRQVPAALPAQDRPGAVAELVLTAARARFGTAGAPLVLDARATLLQQGALRSVADWVAAGGALRIDRLTLADATGPVLELSGGIRPGSGVPLVLAARITTPCPASVLAALQGRPPAPEFRRRVPVSLTLAGPPSRPVVEPSADALARRPVRAQEPPCPMLAG